ncbi:PREDICTED: FHA domain-containing protein FHA2-like [Lupinus angustifolius]|uniref:FHA domain-containing protein FHA2-like n=1 Tax=Lupinus angustifolius TaxID=3871 RepID=UPI00092ED7FA|nr:PREDICTED: FHA domain-containing protein FHA2-like [Lupinus angustifolius]
MGTASTGADDVEAGFAKLQGEDFEYYMQTYSIILGRNSKKSTVDVDLSSLGGGMNISRHHARIFYDFTRRRFALEVLGKNGCLVEGVLHLPGNPPVKLDSQDLLQIGDKEFYFLLPVRNILAGHGPRHYPNHVTPPALVSGGPVAPHYNYHMAASSAAAAGPGAIVKKGRRDYYEDEYDDEDDVGGSSGKKGRRDGYEGYGYGGVSSGGKALLPGGLDKKPEGRSRVDRDADNLQLQQLEEKDVVSSVATVLSDLCGPGEWMPMEKLHAELVEQYSSVWHHSRVRRYLTSEEWPGSESKGKPWYGLLMQLRKYPEHFVINTRSKNRVTLEFVSLVSLIS